jgi:uncharacterized protein (TIGR00369 family)
MTEFQPQDPDFADRIHRGFAGQYFMHTIGSEMAVVEPGFVEIHAPYNADLTQHHGYYHGGVIATLADAAGGFAAWTLLPADKVVLTVEFKLNLLAPAQGDTLITESRVLKPGRTLSVCRSDVYAREGDETRHCATALITVMTIEGGLPEPEEEPG